VLYNNYTITITERQAGGYPVSAMATDGGRVSATLPPTDADLARLLSQVALLPSRAGAEAILLEAGVGLFHWLMVAPLETHFRVAWDRAEQAGRGLRLRLTIDAPEINAWPWELLHDPSRDHAFGASVATPLMRYLDRVDQFGLPMELATELPLGLLLVIPQALDLDLPRERALIEQAIAPLTDALNLQVLEGVVTRTDLSDKLMAGHYEIVHFSGHGGFADGRSYVCLNRPEGGADWADSSVIVRLFGNHLPLKLGVLNACRTGQVDETKAFTGLALQLLRSGARAVVAMQYPLTDEAALTFAREFYRQLCTGEHAGQVDVAVTHARNMLAVLYGGDPSFIAPVLYTHAADGVIFTLTKEAAVQDVLDPSSRRARLAMLVSSLQASMDFDEDWTPADRPKLEAWRETLKQAESSYLIHVSDWRPEVRQVAQQGLALVRARLASLETALAEAAGDRVTR
jgi:hypothetical protein